MKKRTGRREKGAQHKRPGRKAQRERQEAALDRLLAVTPNARTPKHEAEIQTLRRRLKINITTEVASDPAN